MGMQRICSSLICLLTLFIIPSNSIPICNSTSQTSHGSNITCIVYITQPMNFTAAQDYCSMQFGANLVTLVTPQDVENTFTAISKEKISTNFWIGLHDMTVSHSFQWISGYPSLPKAYWNEGAVHHLPSRLCVTMTNQGSPLTSWRMENCSQSLPFLCGPTPVVNTKLVPLQGSCLEGFDRILNRCFKFYGGFNETLKSWDVARNTCQSLHKQGDLASILSMDEQNFVTTYMSKMMHNVWIGLRIVNRERNWTSGFNVTFTNWKPGEPNNADEMSCTVIYSRLQNLGQWNDEKCEKENGFVCEVPLQTPSSNVSAPSSTQASMFQQRNCSQGFVQFEDTCYKMLPSSEELDLEEAWRKCSTLDPSLGTFLSSPHTLGESALMRAFLSQDKFDQAARNSSSIKSEVSWIGSKVRFTREGMVWNHTDNSSIEDAGVFGSLIKFRFGVQIDLDYCFVASSQLDYAKMTNCSQKIMTRPLCAYKLPFHPEASNSSALVCPTYGHPWQKYGSKCYAVFLRAMTFDAAESHCQSLTSDNNTHLASIHSAKEMNFIKSVLPSQKDFWIGLTVHDTAPSRDRVGFSFKWTDSSAFQYYAFRAGEPSLKSHMGDEECVAIRATSYEWNDVSCGTKKSFICKNMAVKPPPSTTTSSTTPTPSSTTPTPKCVGGRYIDKMGCIKLMASKVDWFTAESNCASWNGHLLNIHSHDEIVQIATYLSKQRSFRNTIIWLGGMWREYSASPVHWSDGSEMKYVVIFSRDSSLPLGSQLCLALNTSSISQTGHLGVNTPWEARDCFGNFNYVCVRRDNVSRSSSSVSNVKPTDGALSCPNGYSLYGQYCYKLNDRPLEFEEAKKECFQTQGGELAFPSCWAENFFLSSLGVSTQHYAVWMGAYVDDMSGVFRAANYPFRNATTFFIPPIVWPYSTAEEAKRLVNDKRVTKSIAMINNNNPFEQGRWLIQPRSEKFPFICRISASRSAGGNLQGLISSNSCSGPTKVLYNGACYYLEVSSPSRDFRSARERCKKVDSNSQLLYLTSSFEEQFVVSWLMKLVKSLTPLQPQLSTGNFSVWLDFQLPKSEVATSEWLWQNGDPVLFTHFPKHDSPLHSTADHCMLLDIRENDRFHMIAGVSCLASKSPSTYVATVCKRPILSQSGAAGSISAVRELPNDCMDWDAFQKEEMISNVWHSLVKVEQFHLKGHQNLSLRHGKSGRACWRWDLIPSPNVTAKSTSHGVIASSVHDRFPASVKYGGRGYRSYVSNRCSVYETITHPHSQSASPLSYGCFVSSTEWEECEVISCSVETKYSSALVLVIVILVFAGLAFGVVIYSRYRHKLCFRYAPLQRYPMQQEPMFSTLRDSSDNNQHDDDDFNGTAFYNPTYQPFV